MGLLGNGWDDPQSAAVMSLAGGLLQGNFGQGLLGANDAFRQAKQDVAKQQFMQMQMQDMQQQAELRKQQAAALARKQSMIEGMFGGGGYPSQPAAPGQLGSGSFGAVQAPAGMPAIPPAAPGGVAGLTPDKLALLKAGADIDLTDIYKLTQPDMQVSNGYAYDKRTVKPGFMPQTSVSQNGQATVMTVGPDGMPRVSMPPGALESYSAFRQADEAAKAGSDLVKVYNPATQREEYVTRSQAVQATQPAPRQAQPAPQRQSSLQPVSAQSGMRGSFVGSPEAVMASIENIRDPQERANAIAAFQEQARRTPGFAQGGAFAAGPSTSEATNAAADKERAVQTVKDVAEQRKGIMNAGFVAPSNIARYQQIGKLLQDVDGGALTATGTHLASLANSLGVKIDKNLPNKEAAASLANAAALELRNPAGGAGMPGAMSDADRNFLSSMTPNMAQSAQGRKMVIDAYIAVQSRNQQIAQFARNYEKKHGKLDNGFFDQLSAWSSANPLFKGQ